MVARQRPSGRQTQRQRPPSGTLVNSCVVDSPFHPTTTAVEKEEEEEGAAGDGDGDGDGDGGVDSGVDTLRSSTKGHFGRSNSSKSRRVRRL